MKAWVLHGIDDIRYEETGLPKIKEDEVLVKVMAAGICGSDIPRIYQTGAHIHPLIPGHEFSGEVVELGTEVSLGWQGKRVGVFPLIPCGKCRPCQEKYFEMCKSYSYLGSRRDGGFAEYVAVPSSNLIELPKNVTYEQAAMLEPMAVAVHAIRRNFGELQTLDKQTLDKNIVVYGLGTIGLCIVMFLKNIGFQNIFVVGNKEFQKEIVLQFGIGENCYLDSHMNDIRKTIMQKTAGNGVDFAFECVGKSEIISEVIDILAPLGKLCVVGNPAGDIRLPRDAYWKILRNQCEITGTWNSTFTHDDADDWHYVLEQLIIGRIVPDKLISHELNLEELEHGLRVMRDKSDEYIKIVVKTK